MPWWLSPEGRNRGKNMANRLQMTNREQRLMGAMALLYFGPLLAGLGGFGWAVAPIFAAIFFLWLVVLRPRQFPRNRADWQNPDVRMAVYTRVIGQVLLVTVLFGIGRGIGGVLGALPSFPLMLPLAVSFIAIPLGRLIWDSWRSGAVEPSLGSVSDATAAQDDRAFTEAMVCALEDLPEALPDDELCKHIHALTVHVDARPLREVLAAQVQNGTAPAVGRRVLAVLNAHSLRGVVRG